MEENILKYLTTVMFRGTPCMYNSPCFYFIFSKSMSKQEYTLFAFLKKILKNLEFES